MILKEVDRVLCNPSALNAYRAGVGHLFESGVVDALRALGRARIIGTGNDANVMICEGARSAGWNDCLDYLLYFEQFFKPQSEVHPGQLRQDFSSLERVKATNELTGEEEDAIRNGEPIKYDTKQYTANITIPKRPGPVGS